MESLQITVTGKVQRVWFRKYTQEKANELALKGYVTNKNNGTVFIEVTGETNTLDKFTNWLKNQGSPLSIVTNIEVIKLTTEKQFDSFDIKR